MLEVLSLNHPSEISIANKLLKLIYYETGEIVKRSLEDVGVILLVSSQIRLTQPVLAAFAQHKIVTVVCNEKKFPVALQHPLEGHTLHNKVFEAQKNASKPLQKQLWLQIITSKINNQIRHLVSLNKPYQKIENPSKMQIHDINTQEAVASRLYWSSLFGSSFNRFRIGPPPNNLLNYGYIILRAATARAILGAGLLPLLGVFHSNQYNSFCLADDLMEPYRVFVDKLVYQIFIKEGDEKLTPSIKKKFCQLLYKNVIIEHKKTFLWAAIERTAKSFAACLLGKRKKIILPKFV